MSKAISRVMKGSLTMPELVLKTHWNSTGKPQHPLKDRFDTWAGWSSSGFTTCEIIVGNWRLSSSGSGSKPTMSGRRNKQKLATTRASIEGTAPGPFFSLPERTRKAVPSWYAGSILQILSNYEQASVLAHQIIQ
jgi:hypothetical protein